MKVKHLSMIGCLSMMLMSCGLLESESKGRREGDLISEAQQPGTGDVIADEGEPAAKPPVDPNAPPVDPAMALTGKDLFAKLCASCHGKFEESTIGKTPLNKVTMAIATVPDMEGLKDTKEADLEAIVAALSELPPGKGKGKPADNAQE
jgi:mono/diheme cytochrome c family protein